MHKLLKTIASLVFAVATITAVIAWGVGNFGLKATATPIAIIALTVVFLLHFRRDLAPDLLGKNFSRYFERNGFCFNISIASENGLAYLVVHYQNRYGRSSFAKIALRRRGWPIFGAGQAPFLVVGIHCGPGEYGCASFPVAIPKEYQGKKLPCEIGATVQYPKGKGPMLRFRNGIPVSHSADYLSFSIFLESLLTLQFVSSDAEGTLDLPTGVAETLPDGQKAYQETLWSVESDISLQWLGQAVGGG